MLHAEVDFFPQIPLPEVKQKITIFFFIILICPLHEVNGCNKYILCSKMYKIDQYIDSPHR